MTFGGAAWTLLLSCGGCLWGLLTYFYLIRVKFFQQNGSFTAQNFCFAASARRGHHQRCLLKCSPDTLMDFGNKLQTGCSLADGSVSPRKTLYFICIKGSRRARSGPEIETLFYSSGAKLLKANSSFLLGLGPITKKFGAETRGAGNEVGSAL